MEKLAGETAASRTLFAVKTLSQRPRRMKMAKNRFCLDEFRGVVERGPNEDESYNDYLSRMLSDEMRHFTGKKRLRKKKSKRRLLQRYRAYVLSRPLRRRVGYADVAGMILTRPLLAPTTHSKTPEDG